VLTARFPFTLSSRPWLATCTSTASSFATNGCGQAPTPRSTGAATSFATPTATSSNTFSPASLCGWSKRWKTSEALRACPKSTSVARGSIFECWHGQFPVCQAGQIVNTIKHSSREGKTARPAPPLGLRRPPNMPRRFPPTQHLARRKKALDYRLVNATAGNPLVDACLLLKGFSPRFSEARTCACSAKKPRLRKTMRLHGVANSRCSHG